MNRLERTYRLVLTAYPPDYLAEREEELVATLLAAAPPGASRPPAREVAALVRHGVEQRCRRFGVVARRRGLEHASTLAIAALAALVTLVLGLQLSPRWSAPYPVGFFPFWASVSVAAVVGHLASRRVRQAARGLLFAVGIAGLVAGPASLLVWRSAVGAALAFGLVATLRPPRASRWPALVACAAGVAVGAVAVHQQLGRMWQGPLDAREAFWIFQGYGDAQSWAPLLVLVVIGLMAAWWVPGFGLAVGVNALPATLVVLALATPENSWWEKVASNAACVLVPLAGVMAAGVAVASTLRARSLHVTR